MSSRHYFARSQNDRAKSSRKHLYNSSHNRNHGNHFYNRSSIPLNGPSTVFDGPSWNSRNWSTAAANHQTSERAAELLPLNELPAREKLLVPEVLDSEETEVVDKTIEAFKSRGHFDEFRKDFIEGIERLPNYRNLKYRVMSTVSKFTSRQGPFHMGLKKNKMRDGLRDELLRDCNGLSTWINELVDDLIGPNIERKIRSVVEETLQDFLPVDDDEKNTTPAITHFGNSSLDQQNGTLVSRDTSSALVMTAHGDGAQNHRPERLPTPPPLVKHYCEQLTLAKLENERQESYSSLKEMALSSATEKMNESDVDDGIGSPVPPSLIEDDNTATDTTNLKESKKQKLTCSNGDNNGVHTTTMPQLLFNQLAHFSMYPQDAPPELREALLNSSSVNQTAICTIASAAEADSLSVMVDEPPTGVEDIISPEMMDIEDGHSPDPNSHITTNVVTKTRNSTDVWSADEAVGQRTSNANSRINDGNVVDSSKKHHNVDRVEGVRTPVNCASVAAAVRSKHSRSTLGSLLLEKRKLKSTAESKARKRRTDSDMESISSKSDFESSSSESEAEDNEVGVNSTTNLKTEPTTIASSRIVKDESSSAKSSLEKGVIGPRENVPSTSVLETSPSSSNHVSRYGRRGRQPRRYSPDQGSEQNQKAAISSPSSYKGSPSKSHKSPLKRFYPGNSPSMLQKRRRSQSPSEKGGCSSDRDLRKRKEKVEEWRPGHEVREISCEKPVKSRIEVSSRSDPKHSVKVLSKSIRNMPKVHLSSRTYKETESCDAVESASVKLDKKIDNKSRSVTLTNAEVKDGKSEERKVSSQTQRSSESHSSESPCVSKQSESEFCNSSSQLVEDDTTVSRVVKTDSDTERRVNIETNSVTISASTSWSKVVRDQGAESSVVDAESKLESEMTNQERMELEGDDDKGLAKSDPEDVEEGEITDESETAVSTNTEVPQLPQIKSPVHSSDATQNDKWSIASSTTAVLKSNDLRNKLQTSSKCLPEDEFVCDGPPSPPPLKRAKKKYKKGAKNYRSSDYSSSSDSTDDNSDDSLIKRLNRKDLKARMQLANEGSQIVTPGRRLNDRRIGGQPALNKIERDPASSRITPRISRNKDSWRELSPEFQKRGELSPPPILMDRPSSSTFKTIGSHSLSNKVLSTSSNNRKFEYDQVNSSSSRFQQHQAIPPPPPLSSRKVQHSTGRSGRCYVNEEDEPSSASDNNNTTTSSEQEDATSSQSGGSSSSSCETDEEEQQRKWQLKSRKNRKHNRPHSGSTELTSRASSYHHRIRGEVSSSHIGGMPPSGNSYKDHRASSSAINMAADGVFVGDKMRRGASATHRLRHYSRHKSSSNATHVKGSDSSPSFSYKLKNLDDKISNASSDDLLFSNSHTPPYR